ncbi:MAG TPA: hypothetical protein VNJ08_11200 [Bacteriovoracaceae bacterium]|nr:hypothetical protein [Bacteriovoracaceae bacterium]
MRLAYLFLILFLCACSQVPLIRGPASIETSVFVSEFDPKKSSVKVFPSHINDKNFRYYLYVELKDSNGQFVDCESGEIQLKQENGKKVHFELKRVLRGRYYLTLNENAQTKDVKLNLFVRKIQLKQEMKLFLKKADRNKSWVKAIRAERNGLKMKLFLGDAKGKPVELPTPPEILLNGAGEIENLVHVGAGTWEFDLIFPNSNQIIYISVRAHGKYMADMFRIQHIEK